MLVSCIDLPICNSLHCMLKQKCDGKGEKDGMILRFSSLEAYHPITMLYLMLDSFVVVKPIVCTPFNSFWLQNWMIPSHFSLQLFVHTIHKFGRMLSDKVQSCYWPWFEQFCSINSQSPKQQIGNVLFWCSVYKDTSFQFKRQVYISQYYTVLKVMIL